MIRCQVNVFIWSDIHMRQMPVRMSFIIHQEREKERGRQTEGERRKSIAGVSVAHSQSIDGENAAI